MEELTCPFPNCNGRLINASFISSKCYAYLTCHRCNKRIILEKDDYNKIQMDFLKDEKRLESWC